MLSKALILAAASVAACGYGLQCDDDWPPARFQRAGTVKVIFAATQADIDDICGKGEDGETVNGCSNEHRIVLRNPCLYPTGEAFARLACHELAHHFGGWPSDHPL
jgi:hypothetical protein